MSTVDIDKKVPIQITANALKEVRDLIVEKQVPEGYGLRIGVKGGGCAGFSYILGFDKASEKDSTYQVEDVLLVIEKAHELYLEGTELDFANGLDNRGFIFNNPNAEETCGCGSSFSA